MRKIIYKIIKSLISILLVTYFALGVFLFIYQKKLVYYPNQQDFNSCPSFSDAQKIEVNGTRAYFKKNSDNLVVFYHGNASSACTSAHIKKILNKIGVSYIIVEYSGYAKDSKNPSIKLLLKDVENINQFIEKEKFGKITIMGESLGTALAIHHSTLMKVDNLLLISPFSSMIDMAKINYRFYPMSLMITENYDSEAWIQNTNANNIEIIHGSNDTMIPIKLAKKMYDSIKTTNKVFVEIDGANHNDIYSFDKTGESIVSFIVQ